MGSYVYNMSFFHSRSTIHNFQDYFHVIYNRNVAGPKSDRPQNSN